MAKSKLLSVGDVLLDNETINMFPVMFENKFGERDAFVNLLLTKGQLVDKDTGIYLFTTYSEDSFEEVFKTTPICERSEFGGTYRLRYVVHEYYGLIRMNDIKRCPEHCNPETCRMSVQNVLDLVQSIAERDPRENVLKIPPRLLVFYAERYVCSHTEKYEDTSNPKNNEEKAMEIENSWMIFDCSQMQEVQKGAGIRDINIALIKDCLNFIKGIQNNALPKAMPKKKIEPFITPITEGRLIEFMKERSDDDVKAIIRRAIKAHRSEKMDREMLSMGRKDQVRIILELDLLLYDELFGDQATQFITKK